MAESQGNVGRERGILPGWRSIRYDFQEVTVVSLMQVDRKGENIDSVSFCAGKSSTQMLNSGVVLYRY